MNPALLPRALTIGLLALALTPVMAILPAVLFYIVAERQIVSGLTAGSVKG